MTRFGQVALIVAAMLVVLGPKRQRGVFLVLAAAASVPLVLSGGRLYVISGITSAAIAIVLVRGLDRRLLSVALVLGAVVVVGSSSLWFVRIEQQADNPFKSYLEDHLAPGRADALQWTIPVQLAARAACRPCPTW